MGKFGASRVVAVLLCAWAGIACAKSESPPWPFDPKTALMCVFAPPDMVPTTDGEMTETFWKLTQSQEIEGCRVKAAYDVSMVYFGMTGTGPVPATLAVVLDLPPASPGKTPGATFGVLIEQGRQGRIARLPKGSEPVAWEVIGKIAAKSSDPNKGPWTVEFAVPLRTLNLRPALDASMKARQEWTWCPMKFSRTGMDESWSPIQKVNTATTLVFFPQEYTHASAAQISQVGREMAEQNLQVVNGILELQLGVLEAFKRGAAKEDLQEAVRKWAHAMAVAKEVLPPESLPKDAVIPEGSIDKLRDRIGRRGEWDEALNMTRAYQLMVKHATVDGFSRALKDQLGESFLARKSNVMIDLDFSPLYDLEGKPIPQKVVAKVSMHNYGDFRHSMDSQETFQESRTGNLGRFYRKDE